MQMVRLGILCDAVNDLQRLYKKPFIITSGVRSPREQALISPDHPHDCHVLGAAVDIKDDLTIFEWCKANKGAVTELGIYLENEVCDPGHLHLQILPPASSRWIFNP